MARFRTALELELSAFPVAEVRSAQRERLQRYLSSVRDALAHEKTGHRQSEQIRRGNPARRK